MKLTLGFSPCPNDTFIFDALVNNKINNGGIKFEVILEDVETLNKLALKSTLDISKISYAILPLVTENYFVLNSGGALGTGVGPLLISGKEVLPVDINDYTIAVPGEHTTAHFLFMLVFPEAKNKIFLRYDKIEEYILSSKDKKVAGIIIHENRFTYLKKGLVKILDLGEYWERITALPIPLGGIVAKRNIHQTLLKNIDGLIKQSIQYSFKKYPMISEYVRENAQEMEEDVIRKHIDLYVNNYTVNLREKGKNAVSQMLKLYKFDKGDPFQKSKKIFLTDED